MVPGKRSYGTLTIENSAEQVYYVFDILQYDGDDITAAPYTMRHKALKGVYPFNTPHVQLAPITPVNTWEEVYALRDEVWARDGEGLILKRMDAPYTIGKRPKNTWIKIKKLQSALFTVTGFTPSRGQINDRGPYGMTKLVDEDGIETQVKTKNDAQCREFEREAALIGITGKHPRIGQKLWCEYQERTPDMEYRHIRWDHWDGE
jgi:ATP-dependent DNA ligase